MKQNSSPAAAKLVDRIEGAKDGKDVSSAFWASNVAICSPHRAQNSTIRNLLRSDLRSGAFVETVDRIQGKERDVVLFSYTVADSEFAAAEADFIFSSERLNVAITRAKTKLIVLVSKTSSRPSPTTKSKWTRQKFSASLSSIQHRLPDFALAKRADKQRLLRSDAGAS
ncbi:hypothetical protein HED50_22840 [Ochrobactrum oryzae]|nr:hypothetical protein [Brucella oryzae]